MARGRKKINTGAGKAQRPATPKTDIARQVRDLAEPLCEAEGLELVHVEYQRERGGRTLRIYIDRPGGTRLDDCVNISRQLSDLLDVYLDSGSAYNLEVSSPGPERPLGKKEDFNRFIGHPVKVRARQPIEGRKNFKGTLMGVTADRVDIRMDDTTVAIPLEQIKSARLVDNQGER